MLKTQYEYSTIQVRRLSPSCMQQLGVEIQSYFSETNDQRSPFLCHMPKIGINDISELAPKLHSERCDVLEEISPIRFMAISMSLIGQIAPQTGIWYNYIRSYDTLVSMGLIIISILLPHQ